MSNEQGFLPQDYVEKRLAARTNIIFAALCVVVLVAVAGAFYVTNAQFEQEKTLNAAVDREFEQSAQEIRQIEQLMSQRDAFQRKAKVISHLNPVVPTATLVSEITNHKPTSLTLIEIDVETKTVKAPPARTSLQRAKAAGPANGAKPGEEPPLEIEPQEVLIEVRGWASQHQDVAKFQRKLLANPLFTEVTLEGIESKKVQKVDLLEFRLSMRLNPELETGEHEPLRIARELSQNPMSDEVAVTPDGRIAMPQALVDTP